MHVQYSDIIDFFCLWQAQTIQKSVVTATQLPTTLIVPPIAAIAMCSVAAYAAAVGLYLVSAAGGGYDPVVGTLAVAERGNDTPCTAQVILEIGMMMRH